MRALGSRRGSKIGVLRERGLEKSPEFARHAVRTGISLRFQRKRRFRFFGKRVLAKIQMSLFKIFSNLHRTLVRALKTPHASVFNESHGTTFCLSPMLVLLSHDHVLACLAMSGQALGPGPGPGPKFAGPARPLQILGPGPAQGPRLGQTWLSMPGHGHGSAKQAWGSDKRWCHGIRRKRKHGVL